MTCDEGGNELPVIGLTGVYAVKYQPVGVVKGCGGYERRIEN